MTRVFPPGVGGAETYAYELANGLGKNGFDVDVFTQWTNEPSEKVDTHPNVSVYRISKARRKLSVFSTLYFSSKARNIIDFDKYDIIHGMLMPASTVAITPFNDIDTPVVLTSHGTSIDEAQSVALETPADYLLKYFFHPTNVIMDYFAGRAADAVIAISNHAYEKLTTSYGFSPNQVYMVPHGVDTDYFYPRNQIHTSVNPEKKTVLYVGRLGARKGVELALSAIAETDQSNIEFLIAGTGRHEERLRLLVDDLNITEKVKFLGYIPDEELPQLYSSADVFILPSRYEGFGLVLLEAMACKTPVIGTDVGGIPTAIDDGEVGYIVPRDKHILANRIEEILENDPLRGKLAQNAYDKATALDWTEVTKNTATVYSQICKE